LTHAHRLQGNLLLVHGTGDDNGHYQGTELLINELITHNKHFTIMPYPGRSHSISEGTNTTRHLFGLLTRYLDEHWFNAGEPVRVLIFSRPSSYRHQENRANLAGLSWRQTDSSLALFNGGAVVWQLSYAKSEGQPYFHPLRLPDGMETAALRPADHPWHRGLWWSWKYINGVNY